jgi:hypothetical protein
VEILRLLNSKFKIHGSRLIIFSALLFAFLNSSCSKKPAELYSDGLKSFAAGNYEKAQQSFADGIRKGTSDSLYGGFIAANLVTGKYASINSAYNDFTNEIHDTLVKMYGARPMKVVAVATEIIPYKTNGGNRLPPDFPQTVATQAIADRRDFLTIKQQIDNIIKK